MKIEGLRITDPKKKKFGEGANQRGFSISVQLFSFCAKQKKHHNLKTDQIDSFCYSPKKFKTNVLALTTLNFFLNDQEKIM
jgi:hypothetical protein